MSLNNTIPVDTDLFNYNYFQNEDVCRLCWCRNAKTEINKSENEMDLKNKIEDLLNINLTEISTPDKLCANCSTQVEEFYNFKTFCRETDRKLNDIIKSYENTNLTVSVKIEENLDTNINDFDIQNELDNFLDNSNVESETTKQKDKIKTKKRYVSKRSATYCNICRKDYESTEKLTIHNTQFHGIEENGFKCFGCNKICRTRKARLGHEINFCKNLKDGYKCNECGRFLPGRRLFESHMRNHRENLTTDLPEALFSCIKCCKSYHTRESLKRHESVMHKNEQKNYVCDSCGRVFTRQDYLHKHMLTHTGVKKHVCPHCGFKTTQKSSLTVHIRKHTGERPYKCDLCPQRCISSSNLLAHRRRHLGDKKYECTICKKKFGYKISLEEHVSSIHERSQSHVCNTCGAIFTRIRGLRRHLLAKHRKEEKTDDVYSKIGQNEVNEEGNKDDSLKDFQLKDQSVFIA